MNQTLEGYPNGEPGTGTVFERIPCGPLGRKCEVILKFENIHTSQ